MPVRSSKFMCEKKSPTPSTCVLMTPVRQSGYSTTSRRWRSLKLSKPWFVVPQFRPNDLLIFLFFSPPLFLFVCIYLLPCRRQCWQLGRNDGRLLFVGLYIKQLTRFCFRRMARNLSIYTWLWKKIFPAACILCSDAVASDLSTTKKFAKDVAAGHLNRVRSSARFPQKSTWLPHNIYL